MKTCASSGRCTESKNRNLMKKYIFFCLRSGLKRKWMKELVLFQRHKAEAFDYKGFLYKPSLLILPLYSGQGLQMGYLCPHSCRNLHSFSFLVCYGLYLGKGRLGMVLNLGYQAYYFPGSFLVYLAYSMLRKSVEEAENRALLSAMLEILGFISVPLSFFLIWVWPQLILSCSEETWEKTGKDLKD